jgi:O-antigen ligase
MAELTARLWQWRHPTRARGSDLPWTLGVGGLSAVVVALVLLYSIQAACALVTILLVVAFYRYDRRWGIAALFAFWFLAPGIRRIFGLLTGYLGTDPLSLAPFIATFVVAGLELSRMTVPSRIRRILLLAMAGFAFGFPLGLLHASAGIYAFIAYIAGVSGAVIGLSERNLVEESTLRWVLLFVMVPIAVYAILQRTFPLPSWDKAWLDATGVISIGTQSNGQQVRAFSSLNAPGALAPLLGLSLLCYLTVRATRHRWITLLSFAIVSVALSYTFVRSAWVALCVAGLAHVVASRGRSARPVFGTAAIVIVAALALSPVSHTARDVVTRFNSIGSPGTDTSTTERRATLAQTLPKAVVAPLGHGLGSAGEPTKLTADTSLRAPDDGYLSLIYQIGPIGFILVMTAIAFMLRAAWDGARARAPGQDLRLLLFAMFVYLLVILASGDGFYGGIGVIMWLIGGQALGFEHRRRAASATVRRRPQPSVASPEGLAAQR